MRINKISAHPFWSGQQDLLTIGDIDEVAVEFSRDAATGVTQVSVYVTNAGHPELDFEKHWPISPEQFVEIGERLRHMGSKKRKATAPEFQQKEASNSQRVSRLAAELARQVEEQEARRSRKGPRRPVGRPRKEKKD
jgi:peroxiredoxin family protein